MGVGRIGRTRVRPGSVKNGADAYRRLETPRRGSPRPATMGHKVFGVIVVAIAVGFVLGWLRMFLFGP